jgi:hypothetical protein
LISSYISWNCCSGIEKLMEKSFFICLIVCWSFCLKVIIKL